MVKGNNSPQRLGDFPFDCDICGGRYWYSESTVLGVYTGRGGCLVCRNCADPIDYGLVPYKIPAERPVPTSRTAIPPDLNTSPPFDTAQEDPMSTSPTYNRALNATWDTQLYQTWNMGTIPWGTVPNLVNNDPENPQ